MIDKLEAFYASTNRQYAETECKILTESLNGINNFPVARDRLVNYKGDDPVYFAEQNETREFFRSMSFFSDLSGLVYGWWVSNFRYILRNGVDAFIEKALSKP